MKVDHAFGFFRNNLTSLLEQIQVRDGFHDCGAAIEALGLRIALEDPSKGILSHLKGVRGLLVNEIEHFTHSMFVVVDELLCAVSVVGVGPSVGGTDQVDSFDGCTFLL